MIYNTVNPSLLWEMIKMKVREKSISYWIGKKRQVVNRESVLEDKFSPVYVRVRVQQYLYRRTRSLQKGTRKYNTVAHTRSNFKVQSKME